MKAHICAHCHTENAEDARFCKKCGKRLTDDFDDAAAEERLYERIENRLINKWTSREVVEKEIALAAAARLSDWAKLFAIAVGVPATIAAAIFAFVGIKSTTDLAAIEAKTDKLKETASNLEAQYKPLQEELPKLTGIVDKVHGLETRLSSVESKVAKFAPSSALDPATQAQLTTALEQYAVYLTKLGLPPTRVPIVHVQETLPHAGYDAYFLDNEIFVKPNHANPAKVLHEFSHGVILPDLQISGSEQDLHWAYSAIEAGLANYLTADFLKSPKLDTVDLTQRTAIKATPHTWVGGQGEGGMAWGGYLWALRDHYTSEKATPAIVRAFQSLRPSKPPPNYQAVFLKNLIEAGLDSETVNMLAK